MRPWKALRLVMSPELFGSGNPPADQHGGKLCGGSSWCGHERCVAETDWQGGKPCQVQRAVGRHRLISTYSASGVHSIAIDAQPSTADVTSAPASTTKLTGVRNSGLP